MGAVSTAAVADSMAEVAVFTEGLAAGDSEAAVAFVAVTEAADSVAGAVAASAAVMAAGDTTED